VIKINLAPPTDRKRRTEGGEGVNLGLVFGALAALLVLSVGGYWWTVSAEVSALNDDIQRSRAEIARLKPIIEEGQRHKREKEELERRVNAIEMVARDQARPTYLLDALAAVLPADLWLTRMEEKDAQLKIAGTAFTSTAIADFMANLKASGKFKDVDLTESRQDLSKSPRTITFEVTCRFEI